MRSSEQNDSPGAIQDWLEFLVFCGEHKSILANQAAKPMGDEEEDSAMVPRVHLGYGLKESLCEKI